MSARGYGGGSRDERQSFLRLLNGRVADAARRHHFETPRIPFQCECGIAACDEFALHTLAEYEASRESGSALLAPGHV